jgi:hypothetical protein
VRVGWSRVRGKGKAVTGITKRDTGIRMLGLTRDVGPRTPGGMCGGHTGRGVERRVRKTQGQRSLQRHSPVSPTSFARPPSAHGTRLEARGWFLHETAVENLPKAWLPAPTRSRWLQQPGLPSLRRRRWTPLPAPRTGREALRRKQGRPGRASKPTTVRRRARQVPEGRATWLTSPRRQRRRKSCCRRSLRLRVVLRRS